MALNFTVNFLSGIPIPDYQDIGDSLPIINKAFDDLDTRVLLLSTQSEEFKTLTSMVSTADGGTTYFLTNYVNSIPETYLVFLDGVKQRAYTDYTINNSISSIVFLGTGIRSGIGIEVIRPIGIVPTIEDPTKLSRTGGTLTGTLTILTPNSNHGQTNLEINSYGSGTGGGVKLKTATGTYETPTGTSLGKIGYIIGSSTHNGITWVDSSAINFGVHKSPTNVNDHPSYIQFQTTETNLAGRTTRMQINSAGNIGIGTEAPNERLTIDKSMSFIGASAHYIKAEYGSDVGIILFGGTSTGRNSYLIHPIYTLSGWKTDGLLYADASFDTILPYQERKFVYGSEHVTSCFLVSGTTVSPSAVAGDACIAGLRGFAYSGGNTFNTYGGGGNASIDIRTAGQQSLTNGGGYITFSTMPMNSGTSTSGLERMRITSEGNVAIGTNAPKLSAGKVLHFSNNSIDTTAYTFDPRGYFWSPSQTNLYIESLNNTAGIRIKSPIEGAIQFCDSNLNETFLGSISLNTLTGRMDFNTGGSSVSGYSTKMVVTSSGDVGIGTVSPYNTSGFTSLTINSPTSGGRIDFQRNGTRMGLIYSSASTNFDIEATGVSNRIRLNTNGQNRILIDESGNTVFTGNVGIDVVPTQKLTVAGSLSAQSFYGDGFNIYNYYPTYTTFGNASAGIFAQAVCFIDGDTGNWTAPPGCYTARVTLVAGGGGAGVSSLDGGRSHFNYTNNIADTTPSLNQLFAEGGVSEASGGRGGRAGWNGFTLTAGSNKVTTGATIDAGVGGNGSTGNGGYGGCGGSGGYRGGATNIGKGGGGGSFGRGGNPGTVGGAGGGGSGGTGGRGGDGSNGSTSTASGAGGYGGGSPQLSYAATTLSNFQAALAQNPGQGVDSAEYEGGSGGGGWCSAIVATIPGNSYSYKAGAKGSGSVGLSGSYGMVVIEW